MHACNRARRPTAPSQAAHSPRRPRLVPDAAKRGCCPSGSRFRGTAAQAHPQVPRQQTTMNDAERLPPTPAASSSAIRARLQRLPSRDTKPELAVRRRLHALGFRFRVNARLPIQGVRRSADLVFGPAKVAVFIDGCWIHHCPNHYKPSKSHADWWTAKIEGNERRDRDTDHRLLAIGWLPLRAW